MSIQRVPEETAQERIRQADRPVVLDFWKDDCPPCDALAPILRSVAEAYEDRVKVLQVNVGEGSAILETYGIKSVPTVLFFRSGDQVDEMSGRIRRGELQEAFQNVAASS